jgi:hypothetical protein
MADITRQIETIFTANTSKFSLPVQAMSQQASAAGMALGKLTGVLGGLAAGLGVFESFKGIADLGSQAEDSKIKIAGFLGAMGKTSDFNQGLQQAKQTMRAITVASAALPGEAEDYVNVFQAGMVVVDQSLHGTTKDIYDFTNKYAAITATLGIESHQAGMDLQRMLQAGAGRAGMHVATWNQLANLMKSMPKYADMTAQKFNAMVPEKRIKVLEDVMGTLQPMLDASAQTWTAQIGALTSNMKMLVRESTEPLFEAMKTGLSDFNSIFLDSQGNWTEFGSSIVETGKLISTHIGGAIKSVTDNMKLMVDKFNAAKSFLGQDRKKAGIFDRLDSGVTRVAGAAGNLVSQNGVGMGVAGAAVASGGVGAIAALPIMGLVNALQRADVLATVFDKLSHFITPLSQAFEGMMKWVNSVSNVLGDLISGILPGLLDYLGAILNPLFQLAGAMFSFGSYMYDQLRPQMVYLGEAVGRLFTAMATQLHPILRLMAAAFMWLYKSVMHQVIPKFQSFAEKLGLIIDWMVKMMNKFGANLQGTFKQWEDEQLGPEDETGGGVLSDLMKSITAAMEHKEDAEAKKDPMAARPAANTVQDFRGSKFDITQKFAEGFDPDRVAVALSSDLGRIGEQKLQSGFEPTFGIR